MTTVFPDTHYYHCFLGERIRKQDDAGRREWRCTLTLVNKESVGRGQGFSQVLARNGFSNCSDQSAHATFTSLALDFWMVVWIKNTPIKRYTRLKSVPDLQVISVKLRSGSQNGIISIWLRFSWEQM